MTDQQNEKRPPGTCVPWEEKRKEISKITGDEELVKAVAECKPDVAKRFRDAVTHVIEKTREIGILKALGASPGDIMGLLVRETLLLALAGWVAGILLSFLANWAINHFVRASLHSIIAFEWWWRVAIIAAVASLLGALYPGMRAARQDAIEALAYE